VSGATLTIEDGATVKFDAGAACRLGDTASGNAGNLVMLARPAGIHPDGEPTGSPVRGVFWRGLEIQKTAVRKRGATSTSSMRAERGPNLIDEAASCSWIRAATVDPGTACTSAVHPSRRCINFAGNLHVHRSRSIG